MEHMGKRSPRLIVYLQECGKFIIELPYHSAARIAAMLRPVEEPDPELGTLTWADADRIRNWLPGKRVWVRWTVYESTDHTALLFGGDVIETVQEEENG